MLCLLVDLFLFSRWFFRVAICASHLIGWEVYAQVASQDGFGTLGAIVRSQTGNRQVGFLTNRHVAVNLDYPSQKMFHPLPPTLGPGVYLGAVERATSFITDDLWFGIFAGINPGNVFPICVAGYCGICGFWR